MFGAVGLIGFGIVCSFGSWVFHRRTTLWLRLVGASMASSALGVLIGLIAASSAAIAYDRPQVSAQYDGKTLSFSGSAALLKSNDQLSVTVYGYPPGCCTSPPQSGHGEDRGSELYAAATGPDPKGTAKLSGRIPVNASSYEQVEVRVYRTGEDSNCLAPLPNGRRDPTACVSVWTQPLKPKFSTSTSAPPTP